MLHGKSVGVVVPAYNEQTQIGKVIETVPEFVDRIVVINDCSNDRTREVVEGFFGGSCDPDRPLPDPKTERVSAHDYGDFQRLLEEKLRSEEKFYPAFEPCRRAPDSRIVLLNHRKNQGKGGGIVTGYKWCSDAHIDCVATMDGDGQMAPDELESLCLPIVSGKVDYAKANRLIHSGAKLAIPQIRFLGNSILSILTKIASGYWHVSDTQTGYAAISLTALQSLDIYKIYRSYGYPNDVLVKLNINRCTITEVESKPIYHIGEQSKMKIRKVIPRLSMLLLRLFFLRLWQKYLFRDFHPLFLLYHFGFLLLLGAVPYAVKIIYVACTSSHPVGVLPVLAFFFLFITGIQFLLFAMWMDIQDNERLYR